MSTESFILTWAVLNEGSPPSLGEELFTGKIEDAVDCLQSRANEKHITFGQVLYPDGKIFKNIAAVS